MSVTQEQLRAGRALLHLGHEELARRANVSPVTIRRIEAADGPPRVAASTLDTVRRALDEAGAEFIPFGVERRTASADKEALFRDLRAISGRSAAQLPGQDAMTADDLHGQDGVPA